MSREESFRLPRRTLAMRVRRLRDWLLPALAGSVVGMWAVTTLFFLEWGDGGAGGWLRAMRTATGLGIGLSIASIAADVWLQKKKWRVIPTGKSAWWISFVGPFLAEILWIMSPWENDDLPGLFVLSCKLLLVAVTSRLLFGRMPS
jgi:hypothetical protein